MLLAQIDPATVANGLASNPLAWIAALALAASGYLFTIIMRDRKDHAAELAQVRKEHLESIKADAKEQREILGQIIPLAGKLVEGLESLERITDKVTQ